MSKQVLNIKQMEVLHDLGIDCTGTEFCWQGECPNQDGIFSAHKLVTHYHRRGRASWKTKFCIPTFTLQELLLKIPANPNDFIEIAGLYQTVDKDGIRWWCCVYPSDPQDDDAKWYKTPLDAVYNKLVEVTKLNNYLNGIKRVTLEY